MLGGAPLAPTDEGGRDMKLRVVKMYLPVDAPQPFMTMTYKKRK
jgi:hypothetical protein